MQKFTFGELKKKLAKNDDVVTERNDEEAVKLRDVPAAIKEYLENELHAKIWENDAMDLPYLYVTIPLTPDISRSGIRMTTAVLNMTEKKIERGGWHIIEKFEPDPDCPDYTILISPYRNPHEPSIDMFDAEIARQRRDMQDREDMFGDDEDDEVMVKEDEIDDAENKEAMIEAIKDNCSAVAQCIASSTKALQRLFSRYKMQFRDAPLERSGDWVMVKFLDGLSRYVDTLDVPVDDDDIDEILHLTKQSGVDFMDDGWGDKKDVLHKGKIARK